MSTLKALLNFIKNIFKRTVHYAKYGKFSIHNFTKWHFVCGIFLGYLWLVITVNIYYDLFFDPLNYNGSHLSIQEYEQIKRDQHLINYKLKKRINLHKSNIKTPLFNIVEYEYPDWYKSVVIAASVVSFSLIAVLSLVKV